VTDESQKVVAANGLTVWKGCDELLQTRLFLGLKSIFFCYLLILFSSVIIMEKSLTESASVKFRKKKNCIYDVKTVSRILSNFDSDISEYLAVYICRFYKFTLQ